MAAAAAAALASSFSSFYSPSCRTPFPGLIRPHFRSYKSHYRLGCVSNKADGDDNYDSRNRQRQSQMEDAFRLLTFSSVTLTVISSSLLSPEAAAVAAAVKGTTEKRRGKKSEAATLSPEQLKAWYGGLPSVTERIPYTDVLHLKKQGKLKHIIKLSSLSPKQPASNVVLVVLDDSRVLRTVFPDAQRDKRFWESWDQLGMDAFCVNAYTPPVKKLQMPSSYLGFLRKVPFFLLSLVTIKIKSTRMLELEKTREELNSRREAALRRVEDKKFKENVQAQKRMEYRKQRAEIRKLKKAQFRRSIRQSFNSNQEMGLVWAGLASDSGVTTVIGFVIFFLFYWFVVLNYKMQKADYDDRLKLEEAEKEERKKMRKLERQLAGIAQGRDDGDEGKGEQNPYLKMAMKFLHSGARVRLAGLSKLPQYMETDNDVKFTDVAGLGKLKFELEEVVKFFTQAEIYRRRGVKIPGGILLCGPPGVGKTLLAKAVAGEAGVNFFSISASQFVEIYIGVGASRVRALYQEAKENAPAIVFIDEIDAVGRERGKGWGTGGQERDATLNQLLVCLDGFEGRGDVITIGATNRPDILDPALVRPGRFDRKIFIPKPGLIGRTEILQVHARKKPMAEDVDYATIAGMTDGYVGAELANIVEIAAINIMRDGRSEITTDDLLQAAQVEESGLLSRKERSLDVWKRLARNEAATAIAAINFPDLKNVEFITISPCAGRELGYVRFKMDQLEFVKGMLSRQSLLDYITMQVAPRAADEIWYGSDQLSTIWVQTANIARSAARSFVLGGLLEKYNGLSDFWISDRLDEIDLEAVRILHLCYDRAKEILGRNRVLMDAVVEELALKKSLTKQEFFQLVEEHGHLEPPKPNIIDIRTKKKAEFQELMMKGREATTGLGV